MQFEKCSNCMSFVPKKGKMIHSLDHLDCSCVHCVKSFEKVTQVLKMGLSESKKKVYPCMQ